MGSCGREAAAWSIGKRAPSAYGRTERILPREGGEAPLKRPEGLFLRRRVTPMAAQVIVQITGAWSLGFSPPRASRSTVTPVHAS